MNKTTNYQLNQWERADRVKMEDFNADNVKIDRAIKAMDQRVDGLETLKGNCQIYVYPYTGTGTYGYQNPTSVTFPAQPVLVFIVELDRNPQDSQSHGGNTIWTAWGAEHVYMRAGAGGEIPVTFSGNTMSWYYNSSAADQLNNKGGLYIVVALMAAEE